MGRCSGHSCRSGGLSLTFQGGPPVPAAAAFWSLWGPPRCCAGLSSMGYSGQSLRTVPWWVSAPCGSGACVRPRSPPVDSGSLSRTVGKAVGAAGWMVKGHSARPPRVELERGHSHPRAAPAPPGLPPAEPAPLGQLLPLGCGSGAQHQVPNPAFLLEPGLSARCPGEERRCVPRAPPAGQIPLPCPCTRRWCSSCRELPWAVSRRHPPPVQARPQAPMS